MFESELKAGCDRVNMKLPLKLEYACRVLAQLGKTYPMGKLMHIDQLALAEAIPKNYLVQILSELRSGGLVTSRRGKRGGYALIRDPSEITVYDVVRVVDSDLLELRLSQTGESGAQVSKIWNIISAVFEDETRKYTLKSFIQDAGGEMWHI